MRKLSRREFLWLALNGVAWGTYGHTTWHEPLNVCIRTHELRRDPRARPLRILHLSDLHLSEEVPLDFIRRAIELGLERNPDLVCLTGDYITSMLSHSLEYAGVLRWLA